MRRWNKGPPLPLFVIFLFLDPATDASALPTKQASAKEVVLTPWTPLCPAAAFGLRTYYTRMERGRFVFA